MKKFINYFKSFIEELRKVEWPSKKDLVTLTFTVIIVSVIAALIMLPIDTLLIILKNKYLFN